MVSCNFFRESCLFHYSVLFLSPLHWLICNSYNRHECIASYVRMMPEGACAVPEDDCRHIRQCMSASVATNRLHFWHTKNLPQLAVDCFACLYNNGWSLWLWHFNSNVCVLFIYTINPTSFDDGIFWMFVKGFTSFTKK